MNRQEILQKIDLQKQILNDIIFNLNKIVSHKASAKMSIYLLSPKPDLIS